MPTKKPSPNEKNDEVVEIGLSVEVRAKFAKLLSGVLNDTYNLLIRTHVYHWNVRGPLFEQIHKLLEEQYEALFGATDDIAERIRQIGHKAPETEGVFPSGFKMPATMPSELEMVEDLKREHETVIKKLRKGSEEADDAHDYVTQDLLNELLAFHEKAAWMLRSIVTHWPQK